MNVNRCDLYCPEKAAIAANLREELKDASTPKGIALRIAVGATGVSQMARAALCPNKNMPEGTWVPQDSCVASTEQFLRDHTLDTADLTVHEAYVLAPFIVEKQ